MKLQLVIFRTFFPFVVLLCVIVFVSACATVASSPPRQGTLEEFLGNWEGYWYASLNMQSGGAKLRIVSPVARGMVMVYEEISGDGPTRTSIYYANLVEGKLVATFSSGGNNFSTSEITFYLQEDDELGGTYQVPRPKWYGVAVGYYVLKRKR